MVRKETTTETPATSMSMSKQDLASTLAELEGAANSGLKTVGSGSEARGGSTIVISPPLMPSASSLQASQNASTVAMAEKHGDLVAQSDLAGSITQLQEALGHSQIVRSAPTNVNHSGSTMVMPSGVRDIPNRLYWHVGHDRQAHHIREKADKLMKGLFGKDLSASIARMAASRGFKKDPLVWASQILWENLNYDYPHDFESLDCPAFDNFLDSGVDSPILHALRQCFDYKDVQDLTKISKFSNKSVLGVLRKIFLDEAQKIKMSVPPMNMTPEENE